MAFFVKIVTADKSKFRNALLFGTTRYLRIGDIDEVYPQESITRDVDGVKTEIPRCVVFCGSVDSVVSYVVEGSTAEDLVAEIERLHEEDIRKTGRGMSGRPV